MGQDKDEALAAGGGGRAGGRGVGAGGGGVDASPRTANKVLPHFLAIGNPGSQALVPKEGAEIVRKQVKALGVLAGQGGGRGWWGSDF